MRRRTIAWIVVATALIVAGGAITFADRSSQPAAKTIAAPGVATAAIVPSNRPAPGIRVVGNHIETYAGRVVQLHGVNRPGPEYAAVENFGVFDGPTDDANSIAAMKAWNVNAVRVPLNEDSWLGINRVNPAYNGAIYRLLMVDYVRRLNARGIIAVLNLHFSAPGTTVPDDQSPMADADHSPTFWRSVALTFRTNHSVIFDLFNEPYPDSNRDTVAAWTCVLRGGTCPGVRYKTAGMQTLVNAVRATGAVQPLMIAGPQYGGVVDRWLQYAPKDVWRQLIASVHIYGLPLDSPYRVLATGDKYMTALAKTVPIVIGEFGDTDCTARFSPPLMRWADAHGVGYLAWGWVVSDCADEPSLITNYAGTPTKYGAGVRAHLLSRPNAW